MSLPELRGVLSAADMRQTAATIAEAQEASGAIPWFPGGHTDPWDHVESAMAADVVGLHDVAERAYAWLRSTQRPDGSWASVYRDGRVEDGTADANQCAYIAVGSWHHFLATRDRAFLRTIWPTVRRALDFIVDLQTPGGEILWARNPEGRPATTALLAGSASMYQSLRCGLAIANALGDPQPDWELAAGRLGHAVAMHPDRFEEKSRWSMDWYYPVLGGALRGPEAARCIEQRWEEFVVSGLGIRCVADRPWVTGAETCELALALDTIGEHDAALEMVVWMQHLRHDDGAYWTGFVFEDDAIWPEERSTWTAAAVILAVDALADCTPTSSIFRGTDLPVGFDPASAPCDDPVCADLVRNP